MKITNLPSQTMSSGGKGGGGGLNRPFIGNKNYAPVDAYVDLRDFAQQFQQFQQSMTPSNGTQSIAQNNSIQPIAQNNNLIPATPFTSNTLQIAEQSPTSINSMTPDQFEELRQRRIAYETPRYPTGTFPESNNVQAGGK